MGSSFTVSPLFNPSGLVGYWPMDEGSGSSTIDASGNGNTGTWNGSAGGTNNTYYITGKVGGYAGYLNGSNNYISIPNGTGGALDLNRNFTILAWINSSLTGRAIVSHGTGSYYLRTTGTNLQFLASNVSSLGVSTGGFTANTWVQVGITVSSASTATGTFYINGLPAGVISFSNTFSNSQNLVVIGADKNNSGYSDYASSLIDDVRIYNRALSAAEVRALYNATK